MRPHSPGAGHDRRRHPPQETTHGRNGCRRRALGLSFFRFSPRMPPRRGAPFSVGCERASPGARRCFPRPSPPCRTPAVSSLPPKPPRPGAVVPAHPISLFASFADARCFADAPHFPTDRTLDRGRAERARVDRLWPVRLSSAHHLLVPCAPARGPPAGDSGARRGTASSVGGPPEPALASASRAPRASACTHPRTLCPKRSSSM